VYHQTLDTFALPAFPQTLTTLNTIGKKNPGIYFWWLEFSLADLSAFK
jgi:hypothetical protein